MSDGIGKGEMLAYVAVAAAFVGGGAWLFYRVALGKPPVTVLPADVLVTPDPGQGSPCVATARWDFHLRPEERESRAGAPNVPRGTRARVIQRGTLMRRGAAIYKVRLDDGREGWAFFYGNEISGVCAATGTSGTNPSGTSDANNGDVVSVNER